jgi:two-component system, sensor histidine kinase
VLGNAVKFTEHGSVQILARLQAAQELLQIEVIDTGVGIPAERLSYIFDPFTQADVSVTRRFGGTGLGLSICDRMAKALGGSIAAQSCEGQGSTFTVTIATGPLSGVSLLDTPPPEALEAAISPANQAPTRLTGFRVLVVDDGETNRRLLKLLLTRVGAAVEIAENGLAAVERASAEAFDVILMDMQMPLLDGYSATRELRARDVTTPIVALTAHAMAGDRERCLEAGCDDYLTKPVNRNELVAALARLRRETPEAAFRPSIQNSSDTESDSIGCELDLSDPEVKDIVGEFVARLPQDLAELRAAWDDRNWLLLHQRSHSLKGTAAMTGFSALSHAAAAIDDLAASQREPALPVAVTHLQQIVRQICNCYESITPVAAE